MSASRPAASFDLVLRHGTVVGPRRTARGDVAISGGRIAAVGRVTGRGGEEIDASGCLVLPGGVDAHTHLAWDNAGGRARTVDDHYSGTVAAAFGGVTTIIDYVRQPADRSLLETIAARVAQIEADAVIDVGLHVVPTIREQRTLDEIEAVAAAGVPSVKLFLNRTPDEWLLAVLRAAKAARSLVMLHCDTAAVIEEALSNLRLAGRATARNWAEVRPPASEILAVLRAIDAVRQTGAPVCLVHISTPESIAEVARARRAGLPVHIETRPGYLLLTEERYADPDPGYLAFTGSPPLRDARSVATLWRAIRARVIDTVASDHAAYSIEQKRVGIDDPALVPAGMPSLETQLPALYATGVGGGRITLRRLVELTATTPARLFGLYPRKGVVAVGSDADVVVLDPTLVRTVRTSDMHGRADLEPLDGLTFRGWPVVTISRGEVIVRDGELLARRGRGGFLRRAGYEAVRP